ncbi:MAG: SufE family protein [Formivibrio sp.]|nr:SufE family protein [Formivibrio sp.]
MTPLTRENVASRLASAVGWEAKNRMLVQLARDLPALPEAQRTEVNRVTGCESRVWLSLEWQDGKLQMAAGSDSRVVQGLLALVFACYHGQTAAEILGLDFEGWLSELGLTRFLSASRSSGLRAIVALIRGAAQVA